MHKQLRDVMAAAKTKHFTDEASLDRWLDAQPVDATVRIGLKHFLQATGELATDRHVPPGAMATDTDHAAAPATYVDRLLTRAGLQPGRRYTEAEVDRHLQEAAITDVESRVACKTRLAERAQLR
jgi:hypothetical protein